MKSVEEVTFDLCIVSRLSNNIPSKKFIKSCKCPVSSSNGLANNYLDKNENKFQVVRPLF